MLLVQSRWRGTRFLILRSFPFPVPEPLIVPSIGEIKESLAIACPDSLAVSCGDSSALFVYDRRNSQHYPELFGIVQNRLESESSRVGLRHKGLYTKYTLKLKEKKHNEIKWLFKSTLYRMAPVDSDQLRFRMTPTNYRRKRMTPHDSDSARLRLRAELVIRILTESLSY